jgi:hypothetical protein
MSGAIHPLPQYAFMVWCLVKKKAQGQLYLYEPVKCWNGSTCSEKRIFREVRKLVVQQYLFNESSTIILNNYKLNYSYLSLFKNVNHASIFRNTKKALLTLNIPHGPVPMAARSKARKILIHSNTGIVVPNPARATDVSAFFCVVLSRVGSGLEIDWFPVQGVLPKVAEVKFWTRKGQMT